MNFSVRNHRLHLDDQPVPYRASPNRTPGFVLKPEGIVVHDTAGRLNGDSSVRWLCNPEARASAHLVVYRDGKVVQLVPFNAKAWHAGKSSLQGRPGVNNFSIGIEIVNPGKLKPQGNGRYRAWFGKVYSQDNYPIVEMTTPEHGTGGWMDYTEEQLTTVEAICVCLFAKYSLSWLWPHWKVKPTKEDTNPLFPLRHLQAKVMGREGEGGSEGVMLANTNQRRWPSYQDNIIQVIPKGTVVEVLRSGWYVNGDEHAQWFLVSHDGHEGWVHGTLIEVT